MYGHVDNFSRYGTGATSRTNMLAGMYSSVSGLTTCQTVNPPTDQTHHGRRLPGATITPSAAFPYDFGNVTEVYLATRASMNTLPSDNTDVYMLAALDNNQDPQCCVGISTTGQIQVRRGGRTGTLIGQTTLPEVTANGYYHYEAYFKIDSAVGRVEVRVNGETVLEVENANTRGTAQVGTNQADCPTSGSSGPTIDFSDVSAHSTTGDQPTNFAGDVQWLTCDMVQDGTPSGWTRNAGSFDYEAIDDVAPDGDTTYIQAANSGDQEVFIPEDVPGNTSEIVAVATVVMQRKTGPGVSNNTVSILNINASPDAQTDGDDIALSEQYVYHQDIHAYDPATGVPWVPSEFNSGAALKLTRTA